MDPIWAGIGVLVIAVIGGGLYLHDRVNRNRAKKLLATRPQLSPIEFGDAYFSESGPRAALAAEIRQIVSRHVPFKLEGLHPDDTFVQDLRMDELDSLSTVELLIEIEGRYGIEIPDGAAGAMRSFRDLVDYLEPRVQPHRMVEGATGRPTSGCS